MPETGNALSRNPNICASCSSMADGMEESTTEENARLASGREVTPARTEALDGDLRQDKAAELAAHPVPK
ncbi:MAG: hypothetical protein ACLQU3_06170 [Limisphaerales bacterium]